MKRLLKNLFITLAFILFIGWLIDTPASKIGFSRPYIKAPKANQQFSPQELNDFVLLLARAENSSIKPYMNSVSLRSSGNISWYFKRWLSIHDWNAERFLYDEARLSEIIKCVSLQKNYQDNISISRNQNLQLHDIIQNQKQQLSMCSFDNEDYSLVADNYAAIVKTISIENKKE